MNHRVVRISATHALIVAGLAACARSNAELPYFRSAAMTPEWLPQSQASAPGMHHVAAFSFTDHRGATVTDAALTGHVTIVQFFFTMCGDVCPLTTRNVADLLATLPADAPVQVLSYSVTPEQDSVPVLAAYAAKRGITDARWHFLTGAKAKVDDMARRSYFVTVGDGKTYGVESIAHTESLLLVDGDGRLRGVYAGTLAVEMARLSDDVRALLTPLEATPPIRRP